MTAPELPLTPEQATYFRDRFRQARASALSDAEAWHTVIVALEQLVAVVAPRQTLDAAAHRVGEVAAVSVLASEIPAQHRQLHTPFDDLYSLVRHARNAALHEGAFARRLTRHAVELCLVLENALASSAMLVCDYMVRDPICAERWQPVSFLRQMMLANSFSYLPVAPDNGGSTWRLVSDLAVARYIRGTDGTGQPRRLATRLAEATESGGLQLQEARACRPDESVTDLLARIDDERPILVIAPDGNRLLGILAPFDVL